MSPTIPPSGPLPSPESRESPSAAQSPALPIPALIILDKDGTLIDFHSMWSGWIERLTHALSAAAGQPLTEGYYAFVGYDSAARRTIPGGRLAQLPMATLYALTIQFLHGLGVPDPQEVAAAAWSSPDPINDAHPTTDLHHLLTTLRSLGCRLAVATTDDREPSLATLSHLGLLGYFDALLAADEGVPIKPAPDMVLHLCGLTGCEPSRTLVVGDSLDDMRMAKAAGVPAIGVLTGITSASQLATVADHLLDHVGQLPSLFQKA